MAAILRFEQRNKADKTSFAPGHTATILLYTGVRFERIDFTAGAALNGSEVLPQHQEQTRLAN